MTECWTIGWQSIDVLTVDCDTLFFTQVCTRSRCTRPLQDDMISERECLTPTVTTHNVLVSAYTTQCSMLSLSSSREFDMILSSTGIYATYGFEHATNAIISSSLFRPPTLLLVVAHYSPVRPAHGSRSSPNSSYSNEVGTTKSRFYTRRMPRTVYSSTAPTLLANE